MANFGGRDYKTDTPRDSRDTSTSQSNGPEQRPVGDGGGGYDRGGGYRNGGGRGYSGGDRGGSRDPNYAFITYLYPSKNGKGGFSVFLKRDMVEILRSLEDDDIIGISPSGKYDGWSLYARRVDPQQKDEYRRGGGGRGGVFRR